MSCVARMEYRYRYRDHTAPITPRRSGLGVPLSWLREIIDTDRARPKEIRGLMVLPWNSHFAFRA